MNHKKPSKEELEEGMKKSLENLEKIETPPSEPPPSEPTPIEPPSEPIPSPSPEIPTPSEPPPSKEVIRDIAKENKKKFSESSREAQIVSFSKKQLEEQIDEAQNMPEPTENELVAEFPDWDTYSELEKRLAKDNFHQRRINERVRDIRNQQKEAERRVNERVEEIREFMIDPKVLEKFPKLEGRQKEFEKFATKPTRLTLDLEDLAKLFLYELPEPDKHHGKMFETGSGGPNDRPKPKSDKITIEQARQLMKSDYKKYVEYLKAGKIDLGEI
jgi:hypothetical protein